MHDRPRVLVSLLHTESVAVADWLLAEGFEPVRRSTLRAVHEELQARPCALLIADASFPIHQLHTSCRLRGGPIPTILIGDAPAELQTKYAGAHSHLERPLDRAILMCYVSMAILDARPVRRSVRKSVIGFEALVNGIPSNIVDVSAEGLRLELGSEKRAVLPPYFTVRVPLVGVAVTVQRMWAHSSASRASTMCYGGALSRNRASMFQAWKSFVETVPAARQTGLLPHP